MFKPLTATGAVEAPTAKCTFTDAQLHRQIETAIRAGRVVTVADVTIRYCRRGQEFADQGEHFQPLISGVFVRLNVFDSAAADATEPTRTTWGYYSSLDDLGLVLKDSLAHLSPRQRAELSLNLAFSSALAALRAEAVRGQDQPFPADQFNFNQPPVL